MEIALGGFVARRLMIYYAIWLTNTRIYYSFSTFCGLNGTGARGRSDVTGYARARPQSGEA